MPPLRIHIYVQHLLGSGHTIRMQTLATALAQAGHQTTLITGGLPLPPKTPPPYQTLQLPPIKTAPGDFTTLLQGNCETPTPITPKFQQTRTQKLLTHLRTHPPDALIIETYPFGRRALRFELLPLLQTARALHPRPKIICSLRDILQTRPPKRHAETLAATRDFDAILVHTDPQITTLHDTFPHAAALQAQNKLHHTGYLYPNPPQPPPPTPQKPPSPPPILISSGGGAVGHTLLKTAIQAKPHSTLNKNPWHLLAGPNLPAPQFTDLQNHATAAKDPTLHLQRNLPPPKFAALLKTAAASVSQAGYNTVLDTLVANCPAVLIPYAEHGETEQTHRAETFANLNRAIHLPQTRLTPQNLAAAIARAVTLTPSPSPPLNLNGATASVKLIQRLCQPTPQK